MAREATVRSQVRVRGLDNPLLVCGGRTTYAIDVSDYVSGHGGSHIGKALREATVEIQKPFQKSYNWGHEGVG